MSDSAQSSSLFLSAIDPRLLTELGSATTSASLDSSVLEQTDMMVVSSIAPASTGHIASNTESQPIRGERSSPGPQDTMRYWCTFPSCGQAWFMKYEWERHETKSDHAKIKPWYCAPDGLTSLFTSNGNCFLCPNVLATEEHLRTHQFASCGTLRERISYYRKEQLYDHVVKNHLAHQAVDRQTLMSTLMAWYRPPRDAETPPISRWCGYCQIVLDDWQQRMDHVEIHFKSGSRMNSWTPYSGPA